MNNKSLALVAAAVGSLTLPTAVKAAPGELDSTFGTNGFVWIDTPGQIDRARGAAVQDDGKLLVGRDNGRDLSVVRLNVDGSLDVGFGNNGVASLEGEALSTVAVLVQPDGTIVVVGTLESDFAAARFLSDGRVDTSFGASGLARVRVGPAPLVAAAARQGDGKLVIGGSSGASAVLVRIDTAGVLDTSFGASGQTNFSALLGVQGITALAQQADGKLVAAVANSAGMLTVLRLTRDGVLDPSFDGDGLAAVERAGQYGAATAIAVQSDGAIVVGGYDCWDERCQSPRDPILARLEADGTPDPSFGSGGHASFAVSLSASGAITDGGLAIEPDGAILVGGDTWMDDPWEGPYLPFDGFLARILPSGTLDSGFGQAGFTILDGGDDDEGSSTEMHGIARLPDGSVVAAMTTQPYQEDARIAIARVSHVRNHPGRIGLVRDSYWVNESARATLRVRRTGGATGAVSVDYSTVDGVAKGGSDFTATAGTLTWADGDVGTREIVIPTSSDLLVEPDEAFTLQLSNPSPGVSLATSVGTVTIFSASDTSPPPDSRFVPTSGGLGAGTPIEVLLLALALVATMARSRASYASFANRRRQKSITGNPADLHTPARGAVSPSTSGAAVRRDAPSTLAPPA